MEDNPLVFISYAKEDAFYAVRLYKNLEKMGANPWLDIKSLLPGRNWRVEIVNAIHKSRHFIALLSSRSVSKRGFVQKELKLALDLLEEFPVGTAKPFLIPARLDVCVPTDPKLKDIQWVDLFPKWQLGFQRICQVLTFQDKLKFYEPFNQSFEIISVCKNQYLSCLNHTLKLESPYFRHLNSPTFSVSISLFLEEIYNSIPKCDAPVFSIDTVFNPQPYVCRVPNVWYWVDSERHEQVQLDLQSKFFLNLSENKASKLIFRPTLVYRFYDKSIKPKILFHEVGFSELELIKLIL